MDIIKGKDGIEYVIDGGQIVEKCQHKTRTDKSHGKVRHEVCHDCGKTLIYNPDTTKEDTPLITKGFGTKTYIGW